MSSWDFFVMSKITIIFSKYLHNYLTVKVLVKIIRRYYMLYYSKVEHYVGSVSNKSKTSYNYINHLFWRYRPYRNWNMLCQFYNFLSIKMNNFRFTLTKNELNWMNFIPIICQNFCVKLFILNDKMAIFV